MPFSSRTLPAAIVTTGLLVVSACGDDVDDEPGDPGTGASVPTSLDPCGLLGAETVAEALGAGATPTAEQTADDADRVECVWTVEDTFAELRVLVWEPPDTDALTRAEETVEVGERTAYVQGSNESQCLLDVEADGGYWVQLELDADDTLASGDFCASSAAPLAEEVLAAVAEGSA